MTHQKGACELSTPENRVRLQRRDRLSGFSARTDIRFIQEHFQFFWHLRQRFLALRPQVRPIHVRISDLRLRTDKNSSVLYCCRIVHAVFFESGPQSWEGTRGLCGRVFSRRDSRDVRMDRRRSAHDATGLFDDTSGDANAMSALDTPSGGPDTESVRLRSLVSEPQG